jgi:hypothetical protein
MKLSDLFRILAQGGEYAAEKRVGGSLPRWLIMAGYFDAPATVPHSAYHQPDLDIPMDVVQRVLAIDAGERATADLRAMGEGIGKCSVNVPGNINVWQHLKGESTLAKAAEALADAAKQIAAE